MGDPFPIPVPVPNACFQILYGCGHVAEDEIAGWASADVNGDDQSEGGLEVSEG